MGKTQGNCLPFRLITFRWREGFSKLLGPTPHSTHEDRDPERAGGLVQGHTRPDMGLSWWSRGYDTELLLLGAQVQSLITELRFPRATHSAARKKDQTSMFPNTPHPVP